MSRAAADFQQATDGETNMTVKTTIANGRTMAAGFYNGMRLTNRQAQFVEMLRNGLTTVDCADSFGITQGTVAGNLQSAMRVNGIATMQEFRERLDLPPAGKRKAAAFFRVKDAVKATAKDATQKPKCIVDIPGVRSCHLTHDQMVLQLALRFNSDIHNAAIWLDWTVKECLSIMAELCKAHNVQPTLDNFLKIT